MQQDSCRVRRACMWRCWMMGILTAAVISSGWTQNAEGAPKVTFLEPQNGATIPRDVDVVTIRFRVVSPDDTNLMRYQPFVDGLPGNEPIPIDPPTPQTELIVAWNEVKRFPDGAHTITIKVVDAKGREGSGTLTLYKGHNVSKPTAEILQPKSGDVLRGKVPILVRVTDDRGVKGLSISATQKETAKLHILHLLMGNLGRMKEVLFEWDTTSKHPETKEKLFPDGIYLLQARATDQENNEGLSNEVLVVIQNNLAQPVLAPVSPTPVPMRGGAAPPITPTPSPTLTPSPITLPPLPRLTAQLTLPESSPSSMTVAVLPERPVPSISANPSVLSPQLRPAITPPSPSGALREVPLVPLPQSTTTDKPQAIGMQGRIRPFTQAPFAEGSPLGMALNPLPQHPTASTPMLATSAQKRASIALPRESEQRAIALAVLPERGGITAAPKSVPIPVRPPLVAQPSTQEQFIAARVPQPERMLQPSPELPQTAVLPALPRPERAPSKRLTRPKVSILPAHSFRYTVIAGDTLRGLAERFGIAPQELAAANGLPENAPLRIGQRLLVPARPVAVLVDGKPAQVEVPAFVRDGITVGSFRAVIEASGGIVGWDNDIKQATATLEDLSLKATIGQRYLKVNEETVPLTIAPFLLRNRTFLPLRSLGNALGKAVQWGKGTLRMSTPK